MKQHGISGTTTPGAVAFGVVALLPLGVAFGQVTYTSTTRTAQAMGQAVVTNNAAGAWDYTEFQSPNFNEPPGLSSYIGAAGEARHNNDLGASRLFGLVRSTAWDGNQGYRGTAEADLAATFTLSSATAYTFDLNWSTPRFMGSVQVGVISYSLTGPGGTIVSGDSSGSADSGTVSLSGVLEPGSYQLNLNTSASFGSPQSNFGALSGTINFDLVVPGPGNAAVLLMAGVVGARRRR